MSSRFNRRFKICCQFKSEESRKRLDVQYTVYQVCYTACGKISLNCDEPHSQCKRFYLIKLNKPRKSRNSYCRSLEKDARAFEPGIEHSTSFDSLYIPVVHKMNTRRYHFDSMKFASDTPRVVVNAHLRTFWYAQHH